MPEETEIPAKIATPELIAWADQIKKAFGSDLIEIEYNFGDVVIRVTPQGYKKRRRLPKKNSVVIT